MQGKYKCAQNKKNIFIYKYISIFSYINKINTTKRYQNLTFTIYINYFFIWKLILQLKVMHFR